MVYMAKKYITLKCCGCGLDFEKSIRVYNDNIKQSKNWKFFCSSKCSIANRTNFQIVKCTYCNNDLKRTAKDVAKNKTGNYYCNNCYNAEGFSPVGRPKKERTCIDCFNTFTYNFSGIETQRSSEGRCVDCRTKFKISKENSFKLHSISEYLKITPLTKQNLRKTISGFCRAWNISLSKVACQNCSYSKHTEFCHIIPVSFYMKNPETLLGTINDPNNILILCPNCHWEFDNGHLKLENIPNRSTPTCSIMAPNVGIEPTTSEVETPRSNPIELIGQNLMLPHQKETVTHTQAKSNTYIKNL